VLITSYARVHPMAERPADAAPTDVAGVAVRITPSSWTKCVRCWHHREDVGANAAHPELCGRCVTNVEGPGEVRKYA
jgi:isoleucyl-tRNA synthetase